MALNIISSGVFLVFVGLAVRVPEERVARAAAGVPAPPDPVPQAMVLTGIVVAVAATGLALALIVRLRSATGRSTLDDELNE
jgi:multicomponent Na+:H+ antiporter subunit C